MTHDVPSLHGWMQAAGGFGLTERQARFLVTAMLHGGVFVGRQYTVFAGITHGQKLHALAERLRRTPHRIHSSECLDHVIIVSAAGL